MAVALPDFGLGMARSFQRGTEGNFRSVGRTTLAVRDALAQSQFWRRQEDLREVLAGSMNRTRYVSTDEGKVAESVNARRISDEEEANDWW